MRVRSTILSRLAVFLATASFGIVVASSGCNRVAVPPDGKPPVVEPTAAHRLPADSATAVIESTGRELYLQHCAACHGDKGDGRGVAATFLFPKPRDFRTGRFRLVSTADGNPQPADLDAVLVRGMPGSLMPPWPQLTAAQRKLLVEEVLAMRRDGAKEQILVGLKASGDDEDVTEEQLVAMAVKKTTAGPPLEVPKIVEGDAGAVARGQELYVKQSCHSCHGLTGKGEGATVKMVDAEGLPTRPRDFTRGIFKGGHDPASLFKRIALGMPGTPMPSSSNTLNRDQIVDLVQFTLSLSDAGMRQQAILNREKIVAKRVAAIPVGVDATTWSGIPAVAIRTAPLWWRDGAETDLRVQAAHDGQSITLRLSWKDATEDRHTAKVEAFKDAAAMELYRGSVEPFLGMGSKQTPVDAWFWDAARQGGSLAVEEANPNVVVDIYPLNEAQVSTAEYSRPGTKTAAQPDVSLPAKAAGNQIAATGASSGGTALTAGGPGSVTFRMPTNQTVRAHGEWKEGRWTVVLTRTLAVSGDGGVALEPGGTAAIAFALWDGSQRERDGMKSISIWQDLELEGATK